jgi:outer membrane lipoprotein carrier protein
VRAIDKALGSSPAALLAGDDTLEKGFKLANIDRKDNAEWVSAEPITRDTGFEKILLGFNDNKLQEMELIDSFGHTTRIVFSGIEVNPTINNKTFLFKAPKGVDVVGE